ncbi:MAG: hypothetical protein RLZZ387_4893 [Chloroflexota bacterium]|jgi:hypothetical protein
MYIRWIVRKHKNVATANVTFHDAYLVESFRDERDAPRQRTVCYLGNIRQIDDEFPALEREIFFLRAERILASTPEVPPDDREQILGLLRQKVPPLTRDEALTAFRNNVRWFFSWHRERDQPVTRDEMLRIIDAAAREQVDPL